MESSSSYEQLDRGLKGSPYGPTRRSIVNTITRWTVLKENILRPKKKEICLNLIPIITLQIHAYDPRDSLQQVPHSCCRRRTPPALGLDRIPLLQATKEVATKKQDNQE